MIYNVLFAIRLLHMLSVWRNIVLTYKATIDIGIIKVIMAHRFLFFFQHFLQNLVYKENGKIFGHFLHQLNTERYQSQ